MSLHIGATLNRDRGGGGVAMGRMPPPRQHLPPDHALLQLRVVAEQQQRFTASVLADKVIDQRAAFELKSQATANLYYYTPYTPNDAALKNLYGSGDSCSAYGNRNFWRFFHDWFGSPIGGSYLLKSSTSETYLIVDNLRYRVSDTRLLAAVRPLGPQGEISQAYL